MTSVTELKLKRSSRRGAVTKLHNRITKAIEVGPDRIKRTALMDLQGQLDTAIDAHAAVQEQLEEIYNSYEGLRTEAEEEDDIHHLSTHTNWKSEVCDTLSALTQWDHAISLLDDLEVLLHNPAPNSGFFRDSVSALKLKRDDLIRACRKYYPALDGLQDMCARISTSMTTLDNVMYTATMDRPSTTPDSVSVPAVSSSAPDRHTLHIDVPQYDGDPFKWANFATMFTTTIGKRAKGHTNLEIKGHLIKAVKHQEGLKILHNLPSDDMSLDEMLKRLETVFGAPDILVPLIISKIKSVSSCELSLSAIENVYENIVLPYNKFCSLVGDSFGAFLSMSTVNMMTPECKREWLRFKTPDALPDMDSFSRFIDLQRKELRGSPTLVSVTPPSSHVPTPSVRPSSPRPDRSRPATSKAPPPRRSTQHCPVCGDQHTLTRCSTFSAYDLDKKNKVVREKRLCINCFGEGHGCKTCPSKFSCRTCSGRHHTMLHRDRQSQQSDSTPVAPMMVTKTDSKSRGVASLYSAQVMMHHDEKSVMARALLDAGASLPMITEGLASALKLPRTHDPIPVTGIAGTTRCKFTVTTDVCSVDTQYKLHDVTFTVIPSLAPLSKPDGVEQILSGPELRHYSLADPDLGGKVDLVLGVTQTSALTTGCPFQVGTLQALPTQLGLCLSGPMDSAARPSVRTVTSSSPTLEEDLSRLWELDKVPEASTHTAEEESALEQFETSCQRVDGRYSVSLPRVASPPELGDSRKQAMSRLFANERTLCAKDKLDAFNSVVREYFTLDHAELVPAADVNKPSYYLPVHAVLKESSTSTKVRAVFDASARTSTGTALNDQLLAGPNLYPPLSDILIRFRCHKVAVSGDISKMFREILLNPKERDWHRFLFRDDNNHLQDARMKRLTFGVKSSPFLATQVLRHHASTHLESHPTAAQTILTNFYVDDVLSGATSTDSAYHLYKELRELFSIAGMDLRKWRTNDAQLRQLIPDDLLETDTCAITSAAPKALGVHWDTRADVLHVSTPDLPPADAKVTKRTIASITAGVFDVLGLFAPVVISARILFQDIWRRGLSWDEEVPDDLQVRWQHWLSDLPLIHNHAVPRQLSIASYPDAKLTLHGFCDASSVAYGAAIYARTEAADSSVSVSLVIAKARVLPTRPITIPKAELSGALLLAKMLTHTVNVLNLPITSVYAWTDSQIVLFWLPKSPSQLNRFVANRVAAIQDLLPPEHWRHVPTADNPADLTSRGSRAVDLLSSELWWHGPNWLSQSPQFWPPPFRSPPTIPVYSVSIKPCLALSTSNLAFIRYLCSICSSFFSLVRIVAFVCRFAHNCGAGHQRTSGPLTFAETEHAKSLLYKLAQRQQFPEAFKAARELKPLPRGHPLHHLYVKFSTSGHLVAASRVRRPDAPNRSEELIILDTRSEMTKLLLCTLHRAHGHPGASALLSILSSSYHIIGLRNYLKKLTRTCVTCQKALARPLSHIMGLLPEVRTTPAPPFYNTGVDFAGPLLLRVGYTRRPQHIKCYISVFVCMCTKAVHLDLCQSLSSEDFLATLRRFVARRGCPAHLYSDNGTNFSGAREEIRAIRKLSESETVINFTANQQMQWHHIPPRAPHFGGLWEAAVKAMKVGLRKIAGPHPLMWAEMYTLITEVESVLNSRPIAPLGADDLKEASNLTPGHFLIGRPLRALPSKRPPSGKLTLMRRWNLVERLQADFWKYWSSAYLSSCVARAKWIRPGYSLQVGDVVLIKDESLKSRAWPLAVVEEIHPGSDGVARAATLRCKGKLYQRPTNKLVPLITDADEEKQTSDTSTSNDTSDLTSSPRPP